MIEIKTTTEGDVHEIIVNGEVDASSSIHLDNALEQAFGEHTKVLVNLENLNYISSAGLGVFIARLDEIREKKLNMVLFGMNDKVKNVFAILGLEELLVIEADRKSAIGQIEA